jgi:hypothetical protein
MQRHLTFSLSSLMLVVCCAAICASIGAAVPALGIACGVLAIPALIRTGQLVRRDSDQHQRDFSVATRAFIFFESVVVIACVVLVSSVVAWGFAVPGFALGAIVCLPFTQSEFVQFEVGVCFAMMSGGVAAISTLLVVLRAYWSKRQF